MRKLGESDAAAGGSASKAVSGFASAKIFDEITEVVKGNGGQLVKEVNGVYRFDITNKDQKQSWVVDLKTGSGGLMEFSITCSEFPSEYDATNC